MIRLLNSVKSYSWSFVSLHHYIDCFLSQLGYLLSNFCQLRVSARALRARGVMIFWGMGGENSFWGGSRARGEGMMEWVFQAIA